MHARDLRGAIGVHHTGTSTESWDGPANEARIPNDAGAATLRKAFAWVDPDKDADTKAAYKGIHHHVAAGGAVGDAVVNAALAGIEALNGGRGGFNIPSGDRQGVYNHFAAHLRDADKEPPELKSDGHPHPNPLPEGEGAGRPHPNPPIRSGAGSLPEGEGVGRGGGEGVGRAGGEGVGRQSSVLSPQSSILSIERRSFDLFQVRVAEPADGGPARITGYAAVFNSPSLPISDGWGTSWIETVRPRAFEKTLRESADVRALLNHNPDFVLGRTAAGTLNLTEDARGLAIDAEPPTTQWAQDLLTSMRRGDINQMSFGFQVIRDRWTEDREAQQLYRELLEVRLFDVSVVTFPAYPATSASATRSLLSQMGIDPAGITSALLRMHAGLPPACEDSACLRSAIDVLQERIAAAPLDDEHPAAARRRELELYRLLVDPTEENHGN